MSTRDDQDEEKYQSTVLAVNDIDVDDEVQAYMQRVQSEAQSIRLYTEKVLTTSTTGKRKIGKHVETINLEGNTEDKRDGDWSKEMIRNFVELKSQIQALREHKGFSKSNLYQLNLNTHAVYKSPPPEMDFFILCLNRRKAFDALVLLTQLLNTTTTPEISQWIYKIFLKIDSTLEAKECSILRDLAKRARSILEELKLGEEQSNVENISVTMFTCEMIISTVGIYYRQMDLL